MLVSFRPVLRNDLLGFSGENCTPFGTWMDIPVGVARQVDVGRRYEIRSGKEGHDAKTLRRSQHQACRPLVLVPVTLPSTLATAGARLLPSSDGRTLLSF